jgi:hypothetical protein
MIGVGCVIAVGGVPWLTKHTTLTQNFGGLRIVRQSDSHFWGHHGQMFVISLELVLYLRYSMPWVQLDYLVRWCR